MEVETQSHFDQYKIWIERYLERADQRQKIGDMMARNQNSFCIDLDQMRRETKEIHPNLVDDLILNPTEFIKSLQTELRNICNQQDDGEKKAVTEKKYKIYFEGKLGKNYVTPRGLGASQVNQLVSIQGIVTKMSLVQLKLLDSVHLVLAEQQKFKKVEYFDNMDPAEETRPKQVRNIQKKDEDGRPMIFEYGLSNMKYTQTLMVQEVPERTPTGALPRTIEIVLDEDKVDHVKPGDRIIVTGVYKCLAGGASIKDGTFRTCLIALSVQSMSVENETEVTEKDIEQIRKISRRDNLLEYMGQSIAPSIFGHDRIKEAVLLLLLGGTEKNLDTGTHLRGDINILMIGDPSTAKSQMLRYIMGIAPLAINTTGRGTSSVGLTAAVKKDPDTGENTLEAGAMVLADGGVILIDEFDKMNEVDRVAIHEVMEQQTVTIAKAGIHCSLNARCSVVAAANPIYGEYQKDLPPTQNIGLPDSLLSRFDLLFIVLDEKDKAIDRLIAERVTKNHRFRGQDREELTTGDIIQPMMNLSLKQEAASPYVQFSKTLHSKNQKELLHQNFLKKYIKFAKETIPETVLTDDAAAEVTEQWVRLRQLQKMDKAVRTMPITIRSLESLIRLASAHAKLRLSRMVTREDVFIATALMQFSLQMEDDGVLHSLRNPTRIEEEALPEEPKKDRSGSKRRVVEKEEQSGSKLEMKQEEPYSMHRRSAAQEGQRKANLAVQFQDALDSQVMPTRDQKKEVAKIIKNLQKSLKKDTFPLDRVWGELQSQPRQIITEYLVFLRCLFDLDTENVILFDREKPSTYVFALVQIKSFNILYKENSRQCYCIIIHKYLILIGVFNILIRCEFVSVSIIFVNSK